MFAAQIFIHTRAIVGLLFTAQCCIPLSLASSLAWCLIFNWNFLMPWYELSQNCTVSFAPKSKGLFESQLSGLDMFSCERKTIKLCFITSLTQFSQDAIQRESVELINALQIGPRGEQSTVSVMPSIFFVLRVFTVHTIESWPVPHDLRFPSARPKTKIGCIILNLKRRRERRSSNPSLWVPRGSEITFYGFYGCLNYVSERLNVHYHRIKLPLWIVNHREIIPSSKMKQFYFRLNAFLSNGSEGIDWRDETERLWLFGVVNVRDLAS